MGNENFTRTGDGWVTFPVPAGVKVLRNVEIRGGGSSGRQAGLVTGNIDVTPSMVILMYLGEAGAANSNNTGGAGGAAGIRGGGTRVGAGGNGGNGSGGSNRGGDGGGSATAIWIRDLSKPGDLGKLLGVAGGAGGTSGDTGNGGRGGANIGEDGKRGTAGPSGGNWTAATGGRQNQGGHGGISPAGGSHNGFNAEDTKFGKGGNGRNDTYGGGGGASGYYSGGGGQGGLSSADGGGGGGGSNYTGGMNSGANSTQGSGGTGNGSIKFFWQNDEGNHPPTPPSEAKVNGKNEQPGMSAGSTDTAHITAKVFDTDRDKTGLYIEWSESKNFSPKSNKTGPLVVIKNDPEVAEVTLNNLKTGVHYYARLWSIDAKGQKSLSYRAIDFWTNRTPQPPTLTGPPNYMQFPATETLDFSWTYNDQDGSKQEAFALRYRVAGTPTADPRPWRFVGGKKKRVDTTVTSWQIPGSTFLANYTYEWQVRTRDNFKQWSQWSSSRTFSTVSTVTAPELVEPGDRASVESGVDTLFTWRHVNWRQGQKQYSADFRFRVWDPALPENEDADWFEVNGSAAIPGAETEILVPAEFDTGGGIDTTFKVGVTYAWEIRTYSGFDFTNPSQWSEPNIFTAVPQPGSGFDDTTQPLVQVAAGPLGCGDNRVLVAERGGQRIIGEITPIASVQWTRVRDDISTCIVSSVEFGDDCGELLGSLRSWQHELVVYRDGERVWEGPITRVAYYTGRVEIEAKDPMIYLYRRVMRVGYNDTYLKVHGVIVNREGRSVVDRATLITQNALGYDDPNILQYLTRMDAADDAHEARTIAAYQKTAWEEIDDLAATAGLDYTVVGRRIIYNDVHNPIGKLPVMRAGDFSENPIVTEYGMSMANVFIVSSNEGQWGAAYPAIEDTPAFEEDEDGTPDYEKPLYYPFVEQLASAYGESADDPKKTVTADKKVSLAVKLSRQAVRHIANRWPAPVRVRVPDNALLVPDLQLGINQLVPGVWIPVQATGTLREVTQWQKLDSVTVTQTGETPETIAVILSPAPLATEDPDSGSGAVEDGENF